MHKWRVNRNEITIFNHNAGTINIKCHNREHNVFSVDVKLLGEELICHNFSTVTRKDICFSFSVSEALDDMSIEGKHPVSLL